jgi:23S rRNA (cytosine1962-C5)-methyltransferase
MARLGYMDPVRGEPTIRITRRGAERLAKGHPWIYRADLEKTPTGLEGGEVVSIEDGRRRFLGKAFYSASSQISLRLLTRDEVAVDEGFWAERISAALALRSQLFPDTRSARLIHGEADLLPGLVVDRYEDVLVMQTLVPGMDRRKDLVATLLWNALQPRSLVERNDVKVRELEGLTLAKGLLRGTEPGVVEYREGEVRMALDVLGGQKTGAFLDQRENRLQAGSYASGTCLDCFTYGGAFALQLARRAEKVTAVEISGGAVGLARENAQRNRFSNMEVVEANAFDFLRDASEKPPAYDLVVLDPPAFAKNKGAIAAAKRGYKEINLRALQILKPGGMLVTASCSYHLGEAAFEELLLDAARDVGRPVQIVERRGAARDHPALLGVPETRYLKCFFLRAL